MPNVSLGERGSVSVNLNFLTKEARIPQDASAIHRVQGRWDLTLPRLLRLKKKKAVKVLNEEKCVFRFHLKCSLTCRKEALRRCIQRALRRKRRGRPSSQLQHLSIPSFNLVPWMALTNIKLSLHPSKFLSPFFGPFWDVLRQRRGE